MILGAEVALLCLGLYALVTGKWPTSKKAKHVVQGTPARVIGVVCLLPIPLALGVGTVVGAVLAAQGKEVNRDSFFWIATAIEGAIVLLCAVTAGILGRVYRVPVESSVNGEP